MTLNRLIAAALIALAASPSFAQTSLGSGPVPDRAPVNVDRPLGRACQCVSGGNHANDRIERRANLAALSRINASIRAISRQPATAATRDRLTRLRAAAARTRATLQRPTSGVSSGVPHGVSIPERDR
jgi:hypothetical protein